MVPCRRAGVKPATESGVRHEMEAQGIRWPTLSVPLSKDELAAKWPAVLEQATKPLGEETRGVAAAHGAAAEWARKSPPPAAANRSRATGASPGRLVAGNRPAGPAILQCRTSGDRAPSMPSPLLDAASRATGLSSIQCLARCLALRRDHFVTSSLHPRAQARDTPGPSRSELSFHGRPGVVRSTGALPQLRQREPRDCEVLLEMRQEFDARLPVLRERLPQRRSLLRGVRSGACIRERRGSGRADACPGRRATARVGALR